MEALVNFFITNRTHEVQKSAEPAVAGIDQSDAYRWSRLPAGMTYEQWKAGIAEDAGEIPRSEIREVCRCCELTLEMKDR